jgi:hypothetical protein
MRTVLILAILGLGVLAPKQENKEGYVMPFACSAREGSGPETHTTACALEKECVASGFGLLVDGRFLAFDDAGDAIAKRYFETTTRKDGHWVTVAGDFGGDEVHVVSIAPVEP